MPREQPDQALARVLRRMREQRGETQEHTAYRAGITTGSLARIELGQSSPAWATVRRIANALDATLAEIGKAVEDES